MTRRERAEARLERRREWAEKRREKAAQLSKLPDYAHDWAFITQPGPLPERDRINRQRERSWENEKMADYHEAKADSIERRIETTIFSDDADAIEQLQEKIKNAEKNQERMKAVNKCIKKGDTMGLIALGMSEAAAVKIMTERDCFGHRGYAPYQLTNNNANIRRMKIRIKQIQVRNERAGSAENAGGILIDRGRPEGEYCRITFAEKPGRDVLAALRNAGFCWGSGSWTGKKDAIPALVLEIEAALIRR